MGKRSKEKGRAETGTQKKSLTITYVGVTDVDYWNSQQVNLPHVDPRGLPSVYIFTEL